MCFFQMLDKVAGQASKKLGGEFHRGEFTNDLNHEGNI